MNKWYLNSVSELTYRWLKSAFKWAAFSSTTRPLDPGLDEEPCELATN